MTQHSDKTNGSGISLRRLLASIAIISVGLGILTPVLNAEFPLRPIKALALVVAVSPGGWLIGFGLLHPFKKGWVGAVLVFLVPPIAYVISLFSF